MTIRLRLIIGFTLLFGLAFYFLQRNTLKEIRPRYLEAIEESTVDTAIALSGAVKYDRKKALLDTRELAEILSRAKPTQVNAQIASLVKTEMGIRVLVSNNKGFVLYDSDDREKGKDFSQWNDIIKALKGDYGARSTHDDPVLPGSSVKYISVPLRDDNTVVGALTVAKPSRNIAQFVSEAKTRAFRMGLILFVFVILAALVFSVWITKPINALTAYAQKITAGERPTAPHIRPVEMKQLGHAFEKMREALEGKKFVEQYTHTLTHELKSPLSGIRAASEILAENPPEAEAKQFLSNIKTEVARITELVDRMLLLSSVEAKKSIEPGQTIDLKDILEEIVTSLNPQLARNEIKLETKLEPLRVPGDRFLVRHALVNLLQNAVDFSPSGGKIELQLWSSDNQAVVEIRDSGPGIPDYARERIFERFYSLPRPQTQRKSSGLGLSLVREVALLHHGSITIVNRDPHGVAATLRLPL